MKLIGIMGAAGAGKDTVADLISGLTPRFHRFAFATKLREEIAQAFGVDMRILSDRVLKDQPLEQLAMRRCIHAGFVQYAWALEAHLAIKPRTLMQAWGDYRRAGDPDYFIPPAEAARVDAKLRLADLMVVTDCRYPNEVAWVRRRGGVLWRIVRPGLFVDSSHSSERATLREEADATIVNDGSIDQLRRTVTDLASLELRDAA